MRYAITLINIKGLPHHFNKRMLSGCLIILLLIMHYNNPQNFQIWLGLYKEMLLSAPMKMTSYFDLLRSLRMLLT